MATSDVDPSEKLLSALSICTGIRGLERGIERVTGPLRTIAYVEIEAAIIENLVVGMEAGRLAPAPVWANLKTFPWRYFRGKVFLVLGGYPCQPFSHAGKRKGTDDPRHLWPHIKRGIRTARPVCCFFENVYGHVSLGFDEVTESLRSMGYAVEAGIYSAAEVGASHKRTRVFILAILADAKDHIRGLYERWWRFGPEPPDAAGPGEAMAGAGCAERGKINSSSGRRIDTRQDRLFGGWSESTNRTESRRYDVDDPGELRSQPVDAIPAGRDGIEPAGEIMDDAVDKGLEGHPGADCGTEGRPLENGSVAPTSLWPARPGQPQFEWEEPRTIESSVGCTIDGYNLREDLLRALGNAVVEQQAEFAFRDLLREHFEQ